MLDAGTVLQGVNQQPCTDPEPNAISCAAAVYKMSDLL